MSLISEFKEIGSYLQKAGNIDLYNKLIAIQEKDLEIMNTNKELRKKVDKLEEDLKIKGQLKFENDVYWLEENEKIDGPYCPHCWDAEKLLMRLVTKDVYKKCLKCSYVTKLRGIRNRT